MKTYEQIERDLVGIRPLPFTSAIRKRVYKSADGYVVVTYWKRHTPTLENKTRLSERHEEDVADVRAKLPFYRMYRTHRVIGSRMLEADPSYSVDYYYDQLRFKE